MTRPIARNWRNTTQRARKEILYWPCEILSLSSEPLHFFWDFFSQNINLHFLFFCKASVHLFYAIFDRSSSEKRIAEMKLRLETAISVPPRFPSPPVWFCTPKRGSTFSGATEPLIRRFWSDYNFVDFDLIDTSDSSKLVCHHPESSIFAFIQRLRNFF